MPKVNGWAKIVGVVITVVGLGVSGVWGYAKLDGKVEVSAKEIGELEETHEEDVRDINGKLETITGLMHDNAVTQGMIQKDIQYIQRDISEIKNK